MYKLLSFASLAVFGLSGCVVHSYDYVEPAPPRVVVAPPVNYAPTILTADAGVYWDNYYGDDIWYFEATVDDLDSPYDVVSVWADVYDEYRGGAYVESFELFPTADPHIWFSDWLGYSTWLDPFYPGYTVDIIAYDTFEAYDFVTIWPATY